MFQGLAAGNSDPGLSDPILGLQKLNLDGVETSATMKVGPYRAVTSPGEFPF